MKIDPLRQAEPIIRSEEPAKGERLESGERQEATDSGAISPLTERIQTEHARRVEELKRLYEAGQYSVPAAEIASSIIQENEQD